MAKFFQFFSFLFLFYVMKNSFCKFVDKITILQKINLINSMQDSWVAGINDIALLTDDEFKMRLGVKQSSPLHEDLHSALRSINNANNTENIPKSFDARKKWPECDTIKYIYDQANCGSCWAVSVAAAFSDRICIATNGTVKEHMSSKDLLDCCSDCKPGNNGCDGGYPDEAVTFIKQKGICSGGPYNSSQGCKPYPYEPCAKQCSLANSEKCQTECTNDNYEETYKHDKSNYQGGDLENFENDIIKAKKSIMKNGPLTATMNVFSDFQYYVKGIYRRSSFLYQGGHAVKIVGWGEENGVPFWLVANSWGTNWGMDGFCKIHLTKNGCSFGSFMTSKAIIPSNSIRPINN